MTSPQTDQDRDKILKDFLLSLKVSFKNATIYNMDHPAFVRSVENLKTHIESIFRFLSPISMGFTPQSLYLDNRFWEDEPIYSELGRLFHFRKVKSMDISHGITDDELMRFTAKITLSLRDFLREGGAGQILKTDNIHHITVEELDYSFLLKGEGEEISDIWAYLMEEGLEELDRSKLEHVTENFEHVIGKFNTEELIVNEELHRTFSKYFQYLKDSGDELYRKCAKNLVKSVVTNRKITPESKFENLKLLISDLSHQDLSSTLWEEIISDDKFDSLSFSIFSKLIEKDRHLEISTSLRDLFQMEESRNRAPEVEAKIKALLSGTSGKFISDIYRQTLTNLLKDIDFDQPLSFDHDQIRRNYWFSILNILEQTEQVEQIAEYLLALHAEWTEITDAADLFFLRHLMEVLHQKEPTLTDEEIFLKTMRMISEFIENKILEGSSDPELEYFLNRLSGSVFDVNAYLNRIFTDEKITFFLVCAYFKFFTEYLFYFNLNLEQKASNSPFLKRMVDCLGNIDTPISLVTLKAVYHMGGKSVKLKVLRTMQNLKEFDDRFLMPILKSKDLSLKGEALVLLMREEELRQQALKRLLMIQSPYGIKNKILIGHMQLLENKNLTQAAPYLEELAGRKGFWNSRIRREAKRILETWNIGNN